MKTIRVASLFAGCGGMDLGIQGGFRFNGKYYPRLNTEIVHASDFDERVVRIYNLNFKHESSVIDINEFKIKNNTKDNSPTISTIQSNLNNPNPRKKENSD